MFKNFQGAILRLSDNWVNFIEREKYFNQPIKYLEISSDYGSNLLSVAETYAGHPNSEIYSFYFRPNNDEKTNVYHTFLVIITVIYTKNTPR
jgi:hypothetical protein